MRRLNDKFSLQNINQSNVRRLKDIPARYFIHHYFSLSTVELFLLLLNSIENIYSKFYTISHNHAVTVAQLQLLYTSKSLLQFYFHQFCPPFHLGIKLDKFKTIFLITVFIIKEHASYIFNCLADLNTGENRLQE